MPGREPLSSLVNFEALHAETERVIGLIRSIQEALDNVNRANSLFKGAKGGDSKKATDELITANERLLAMQKQLDNETQKSIALQDQLAKQLAIKKEINKQTASDLRAEAKEAAGLNDAYRKLEIQYNNAARAAKNIGITQGTNSEAYKKASADANQLSEALKKLDADQGQHQRNVGNYTGALKTLEKSFDEAKGKLDALTRAGQQNTAQGRKLQEEVGLLGQLVGQQAKGFTSLSREIMATGKALETMADSGLKGTEAFNMLEEKFIEAKHELNEFRKGQALLASEAPVLKSMSIAAKGLGGAYAAGAGAAALFADGNEKVEKELNKLVAIMTVLQGLNELHELIEKKGAIATIFSAAAVKLKNFVMTGSTQGLKENTAANIADAESEEVLAAATEGTTTAMKALRIALIGTGIGALLLLLPLFAEALERVSDATKQNKVEEEELEEVNTKMIDSYAKERTELDLTVAQLKDEKISRQEKKKLIDDLQEKYPDYLKNIKNEGEYTGDLAEAITTKLIPALELEAKAKAAQELTGEKYKALLELQNKNIQETAGFWTKAMRITGQAFGNTVLQSDALGRAFKDRAADAKELQDQIDALFKISLEADEGLSRLGKGSATKDKKEKDFTDYEEGFRQLREEFQKFRQEAAAGITDAYTKELNALLEKYQEGYIKINDVRDKDLAKIAENEKKGILTVSQAAKERVKVETDTAQARAAAEDAYYANLNVLQEKHRQEIAAKKKEEDAKTLAEALKSQREIAKAMQADADAHFREQVTISKNNAAAKPSFSNDKSLAEAERQEAIHNQVKLLDEKKITQQEFDSDMLAIQADYNKKIADAEIKQFTKFADAAKKSMDLIGGIEKAAEERRMQSIERQEKRTNQMYEKERENITNSTLSEQQKAAAMNVINQQQRVRDKQLEQEKHAEQIKAAKFSRDEAVFNIAASTATAIMKAVAASPLTAGLPFSAIAAATGAAQLAAVLAKPLPAYAKGTDSAAPGWGVWGEAGQEAKIDRRGKVTLSSGPSIFNFEGGERIIPHDELNQIMYHNMMQATHTMIVPQRKDEAAAEIKRQSSIIQQQTDELKRSLKDQRVNVRVKGLPPGWDAYIKKSVKD
jgi:hypothetical protein